MLRGEHARRLARWCMLGETRLVLATTREAIQVGALVAPFGPAGAKAHALAEAAGRQPSGQPLPVVHDAILRVCGFTLVHSERRWRALCAPVSAEPQAAALAELRDAAEA